MEGTRLAAACCLLLLLLVGALPPPPPPVLGDGQKIAEGLTLPPTLSGSLLTPGESGSVSAKATPLATTSTDGNATATTQLNATELGAASSPTEHQTPATHSSLATTAGVTNRSFDVPANMTDANQPQQGGTKLPSSTDWASPGTTVPTHPQPPDPAGTTGTSQPQPAASSPLGPTPGSREPAREDAAAESTAQPTTPPLAVSTARRVPTSTPPRVTSPAPQRATQASTAPVHEKASVLDVGDDEEDLPSSPAASPVGADPLVIAVISIFIVTVGILALAGFLRYRRHNSQLEFRRLQDLPMDDMMEDTPLSLYSY